jgi:hypothetical protein
MRRAVVQPGAGESHTGVSKWLSAAGPTPGMADLGRIRKQCGFVSFGK